METLSENRAFGGTQGVYRHASKATGTDMTFGLFLPQEAADLPVPVLWFLSGLTCTHENAMVKAGAQLWATEDLPAAVFEHFALDEGRQAITGHSMGGHGALTIAMTLPDRFASVSAFAPICNPTDSDWGRKQFTAYLGGDEADWAAHDATHLMRQAGFPGPVLIDTGTADQFGDLLKTEALAQAIAARRQHATLRLQPGYDHSYFFISTFMEDHINFHAEALYGVAE